jgi:formylglycine-generating enzyme required for sulfatase activity
VVRGGSWYYYQGRARCACRDGSGPVYYDDNVGFRVMASLASSDF